MKIYYLFGRITHQMYSFAISRLSLPYRMWKTRSFFSLTGDRLPRGM